MAEGENKEQDLELAWLQSSDEFCELHCQSCTNVGKFVPAQGFCVNCAEYFCGKCCLEHKKFNVTKNHIIKNKDTTTRYEKAQRRSSVNEIKFEEKCTSHTQEYIKFICNTCDSLGCSACMTTIHRKCDRVEYIPDIIDKNTIDTNICDLCKDLTNILGDIAEDEDELADHEENVKKYKADALDKMRLERQKVNHHFNHLESRFRTETDIVENEDFSNITKASKIISTVKCEVEDAKSYIEDSEGFDAVARFIAMKRTMTLMSLAKTRLEDARKMSSARRYTFVLSNQILQVIRRTNKLGSLVFTKARPRTVVFNRDICLLDKSTISETENNSKGCSVQGIQLLSEDRLAFTDSFNYSVKLVDINQNKLLSSLSMPSWPFGIAQIRNNRLVVTLPALKQIQILCIREDNNIIVEKELHRGKVCCGVAYHRGLLFVTNSHPHAKLEIIDLSGRVIKVFSNENKGESLFERPFNMALSIPNDTLCVSDVEKNSVTFLSFRGDFKTCFQDKKRIPVMKDVITDEDGVVYVCAFSDDSIYQLSDGGAKSYRIIGPEAGIKSPQALAYCPKSDRLYVGLDIGMYIKVFDVKL